MDLGTIRWDPVGWVSDNPMYVNMPRKLALKSWYERNEANSARLFAFNAGHSRRLNLRHEFSEAAFGRAEKAADGFTEVGGVFFMPQLSESGLFASQHHFPPCPRVFNRNVTVTDSQPWIEGNHADIRKVVIESRLSLPLLHVRPCCHSAGLWKARELNHLPVLSQWTVVQLEKEQVNRLFLVDKRVHHVQANLLVDVIKLLPSADIRNGLLLE